MTGGVSNHYARMACLSHFRGSDHIHHSSDGNQQNVDLIRLYSFFLKRYPDFPNPIFP